MILGDRYEIINEIGSGGMANVYLAKCRLLNRNVAVKILKEEFADDAELLTRFATEAQAAGGLSHPNIVGVYDFGNANGLPYIVMEYVEGDTLKKYIDRNKLTWRECVKYAMQICKALECAHKNNIIHRDIKPHNIIMTMDGVLKVTDFGIARAATSSTNTLNTDTSMGSVHYFSPEQARGGFTDAKSDIYSLGVVMYEMLIGRVPFNGDTPVAVAVQHIQMEPVSPMALNLDIPPAVDAIVLKALSKERAVRFQSAADMLFELKNALVAPNDVPKEKVLVPTQTIVLPTDKIRKEAETSRTRQVSDEKDERKDKKAIIWAALTSVIVIGLVVMFLVIFMNSSGGNDVLVPDLVGHLYEDMVEEYNGSRITIKITQTAEDEEYEAGTIIKQSPKFGTNKKVPFEISVTVVESVETFVLKSYTNMDIDRARREIIREGLLVETKDEDSSSIPVGVVIRTDPVGGNTVRKGDVITLIVSTGPPDMKFEMPNLIGETLTQARRILLQNNLREGDVKPERSDLPKDQVIGQSIDPGEEVGEYVVIDLTVSSGSAGDDTVPNTPTTTKNITVQVPQGEEATDIRVTQDGITIHSAAHNKSDISFNVPVTGSGSTVIEIFHNGTKISSQMVEL